MSSPAPTPARPGPGAVGAGALVAALAGAWLWAALVARPAGLATGLIAARGHIVAAEKALQRGAFKVARVEAALARGEARRARTGLGPSPLLDVAAALPDAAAVVAAAPLLVDAAALTGRAALRGVDVAQTAVKGPDPVIVRGRGGSRVDIARIRELSRIVSAIAADVRTTRARLAAVDVAALPRRARGPVRSAIARAQRAQRSLADARAGLDILPGLLGAGGPRSYLIAMHNPAEQRGTGGAILQFAVLRVEGGRFDLAREAAARTVYEVDVERTPIDIPLPADAWYVRGIEDAQRFGNANWSPDWPLSAELTLRYARASVERCRAAGRRQCPELPEIDGVIGVSPVTMQSLIPGTGPFTVPAGPRISAGRVVHFTLYKAYSSFPIPSHRRAVLRQVVDGFYERLFDPRNPSELVAGLADALATRRVQIWAAHPREQRFVADMGWDGGIDAGPGDYLMVVEQNVGGNKLDYFDEQSTSARISVRGRDTLVSTTVSYRNRIFQPQPRWSMGDSGPLHRPMVNVYAPGSATLTGYEVDGTRLDTPPPGVWTGGSPPRHRERGKTVWSATLEIPPGRSGSVTFDYRVPGAVRTRADRRVYRLMLQHQPKVRPDVVDIRFRLPPGASAVRAPGWERAGRELVWSGPLEEDVTLEVSWRR